MATFHDEGLAPGLDKVEYCEDGHRCLNGSTCIPDPSDETAYLCDCSVIEGNNPHTGRYCEFGATSICHEEGAIMDVPIYEISFCTNGGTCNDILEVESGMIHQGCSCSADYSGDYCEYPLNTGPAANSDNGKSSSSGSSGMHDTLVGMLVFIVLISVAAFVFLAYRRIRKRQVENDVAKMDDLVMRSGTDAVVRGESSMPTVEELKGFPSGGSAGVNVTKFATATSPPPSGPPPSAPNDSLSNGQNGQHANGHSNGHGVVMMSPAPVPQPPTEPAPVVAAEQNLATSLAADVDAVMLTSSADDFGAADEGEFVNGDSDAIVDNEII
mmetsp:Transcript_16854/g.26302  ORF Transcript_16854/g.26302 Transcript_16854/m.26302 type:complete len:327 (+) Transcript_16854:157-1137(+)|eukprot:CAMPEP_0196811366 /NCGR_PEP_ID=MMETSP1362-20130617/17100_1 /TAXON_ID=163516 /ORGANISM="Leptocylindrus danicus, Strain CCMP1856" /LENGTH=326 /DNA_ID=CAMNT_0042186649 /DNA_START=123 /DNA_END=1103 /DNA_ORIENTATION=+